MAITIGTSAALKSLLSELSSQGINGFASLDDIQTFLTEYESKKRKIHKLAEAKLAGEIKTLKDEIESTRIVLEDNIEIKEKEVTQRIISLISRLEEIKVLKPGTRFGKLVVRCRILRFQRRIKRQKRKAAKVIHRSVKKLRKKKILLDIEHAYKSNHTQEILTSRITPEIELLEHTKRTIDAQRTLLPGAIGEEQVIHELAKLPDDYIVLNDYSLKFDPPIYIKKTNDTICSVQIDHVVLSKAGIFLLETKNWSKHSVESPDLRSPVEQILRNGRAIFLKLREGIRHDLINLPRHHWGQRKIPIRNLIVMINNKPVGDFEFVKIKKLKELNGYLKYFDPQFTHSEIHAIKDFLIGLQGN